jgi:hypothetical protein
MKTLRHFFTKSQEKPFDLHIFMCEKCAQFCITNKGSLKKQNSLKNSIYIQPLLVSAGGIIYKVTSGFIQKNSFYLS